MTHHVSFVPPTAFRGRPFDYTDTYLTPFGPALVVACGHDIVFWGFCSQIEAGRVRDAVQQKWQPASLRAAPQAVNALAENARAAPAHLALAGTSFQHRVWQKLLDIPQGHTSSYKQLADALHSAPRAIGGAVGANPVSLLVPCHRVLAADKTLNGYRWGLEVKARILAAEGVAFKNT